MWASHGCETCSHIHTTTLRHKKESATKENENISLSRQKQQAHRKVRLSEITNWRSISAQCSFASTYSLTNDTIFDGLLASDCGLIVNVDGSLGKPYSPWLEDSWTCLLSQH